MAWLCLVTWFRAVYFEDDVGFIEAMRLTVGFTWRWAMTYLGITLLLFLVFMALGMIPLDRVVPVLCHRRIGEFGRRQPLHYVHAESGVIVFCSRVYIQGVLTLPAENH